jgi:hypothetical protein
MVLFKIALVGALLAAALFLLQQQQVFQRAGVVGHCTVVGAPAGQDVTGQWWSCAEGVLTGFPSLARDSCQYRFSQPDRQVWYCPAPLERAPGY